MTVLFPRLVKALQGIVLPLLVGTNFPKRFQLGGPIESLPYMPNDHDIVVLPSRTRWRLIGVSKFDAGVVNPGTYQDLPSQCQQIEGVGGKSDIVFKRC